MYIGSSTDLGDRLLDHVMNNGSNLHLQNAIAKYGLHCFVFLVVQFCSPSELLTREQHWLDWLFALPKTFRYNFQEIAGIPPSFLLGCKNHTPDTKARMSAAHKGKVHPESAKAKMSESQKKVDRSGPKHPQFGVVPSFAHAVYVYSADKVFISKYPSQTHAAKGLNANPRTIRRYILSSNL